MNQTALQSVDIEQQVLGAVLSSNERFHKAGMVKAEHFYEPVHALLWERIAFKISNDELASPVTIWPDVQADEGLQELGGSVYLAKLLGGSIAGSAIADYARELVRLAEKRKLNEVLTAGVDDLALGAPVHSIKAAVELALHDLEGQAYQKRSMTLLSSHMKALTEINERQATGHVGLSTGLTDIDNLTGGLHDAELTIIAGSTSMGKTTLGQWLSYKAAQLGYVVAYASLEMGEAALSQRFSSISSEIPYYALRRPMSQAVFEKVADGMKAQSELPIHILSDKVRDIPSILSESRRLQKIYAPKVEGQKGFGLLVIDYLQLVKGQGRTSLDRLSQVAIDAKHVAKALNVPVVALAQVDRGLSKRENPVPQLSDLRGSGDIENAADNVWFCHRPEYYITREIQQNPGMPDDERADFEAALSRCKNVMEIYVAKQRMGEIGKARVKCDMGTNRFWDLEHDGPSDHEEIAF